MYDGGLVSFAGGGEVDRYQNKGTVDGAPESSSQFLQDLARIPGAYEKWWLANREEDARKEETERRTAERKQQVLDARQKTSFANYLFGSPEREAQGSAELAQLSATPLGATARSGSMPEKGYTRPGMLYDPRLNTPAPAQNQMGANVPPSAAPGAAPSARGPAQPQMNNPPPTVAQPEVDALAQYQRDIDKFKPAKGRTAAEELAARQALVPEEYRGKAYAGLEKSLQGDAETAGKEKDQNFWMSVMQAGLSAASGTSPNALKNIADGMNVGLSSYKESLKEFKKAEKERQKAMADIEQARRAEARGDADTAIKATERSEDRMDKFNGYSMQGIAALSSQAMQERGSTARTNTQIAASREDTLTRERGANARNAATIAAQLNTPDRIVFNKLVEDKGDPIKAAEALQKMKAEKFNMYEAYSKYLTGFAGKETLTPPMDFDQFASKFMVPTTKNPGKGATILTQP